MKLGYEDCKSIFVSKKQRQIEEDATKPLDLSKTEDFVKAILRVLEKETNNSISEPVLYPKLTKREADFLEAFDSSGTTYFYRPKTEDNPLGLLYVGGGSMKGFCYVNKDMFKFIKCGTRMTLSQLRSLDVEDESA